MAHAFYLPPHEWDTFCTLQGQEARHMLQALRLQKGEEVLLFDGEGREGKALIETISKREVQLHIQEEILHPKPSSLAIMALAWSKATRRGFFMEKAVELGVHEVWLWQGDHSQGRVPDDVKEHWHAQCIAAIKQCKNPWLPTVRIVKNEDAKGIDALIAQSAHVDYRFMPWEQQENIPLFTKEMAGQDGTSLYVIGPEGGFSAREIQLLQHAHFQTVSLGNRVLRCETAALLCLGIHWWASQT